MVFNSFILFFFPLGDCINVENKERITEENVGRFSLDEKIASCCEFTDGGNNESLSENIEND